MLFLKRLFLISVIFFTLLVAEPFSQSIYVYVLTGNPTTAWTHDQVNTTYYEIRLVGIKPNGELVELPSEILQATTREKVIVKPRSGDFKVQIRACNADKCSEWADSKDPAYATVDGQPMGWILRWKVSKPSNIIVGFWNKLIIYFNGGNNNV